MGAVLMLWVEPVEWRNTPMIPQGRTLWEACLSLLLCKGWQGRSAMSACMRSTSTPWSWMQDNTTLCRTTVDAMNTSVHAYHGEYVAEYLTLGRAVRQLWRRSVILPLVFWDGYCLAILKMHVDQLLWCL